MELRLRFLERLTDTYLLFSLMGIGIAIYTANEYLTQNFTSCNINSQVSCGGVFQSGHTSLLGIPFYVMGLVWFPAVFAIGLFTSRLGKKAVNSQILLPVLMVGNVFTAYLWYLELAVIHIICPLCVSLYAVNYALTLIVLLQFLREPDISGGGVQPETAN
jgi:uncharacterized membrane protein